MNGVQTCALPFKNLNHFFNFGRMKKFRKEDDTHFLENKKVIVPEVENILFALGVGLSAQDEVRFLVWNGTTLRHFCEMSEGALRNLENQWHKIYIGWHAILGQLKVRQRSEESKSTLASMFSKSKD